MMKNELINKRVQGSRPWVIIYTDGGASPNPGRGGWAAVLISKTHNITREISGAEDDTTNNRMELTAALNALKALKMPCVVELYTDSQYLKNAFTNKWLDKWQKNNWRNANKEPVANQDLWQELLKLAKVHEIKWQWVKGHASNKFNNKCDYLVRKARENL
ncbi:MAG: ribonuclease HI [Synergistaceae bacterium]|nr:ribonuclease HI [Synergistaceae bacterium]MBQ3625183.1 ribonuclease HI [Synergistaceae bacterium]MBQ9581358.1 ribonuclease HI [Synergistaceae bacterium]MBR0095973.1 ribonuclease HI [Synergistaceae bacterium]MBR0220399.1 ribonuclease HI [Synergistaceae bacterium]